MIRRTIRDVARLYRRSWWRLSAVVLIVGLLCTFAIWVVGRATNMAAAHLHGILLSNGHLKTSGEFLFTAGVALVVGLLCLPIALAGVAAVSRITDESLAGRRPRTFRSFAYGLRRAPRIFVGGLAALIGLIVLVIVTPAIVATGILGLLATPLVHLLGRRWPGLVARWPSVPRFGLMAIPFAVAAIWLARTALLVPSATLDPDHSFRQLPWNPNRGRDRVLLIVGGLIGSIIVALAFEAGITWIAFLIAGSNGRMFGQGLSQFVGLALPIVVLTVIYRLDGSAPRGTPLPSSPTAPYGVGAPSESPPFLAGAGADAALMSAWRLRHRRVAIGMPLVLIATFFALASPAGAEGGEGGPVTTPGGAITMTVNSAADDVADPPLSDELASCLSGTGTCTLRAALADASVIAGGGTDGAITINFATDLTIGVDPSAPMSFFYASEGGASSFAGVLTIDGSGHRIILDGGSVGEVLSLHSTTWNFDLQGVEIRNGAVTDAQSGDGAALAIGGSDVGVSVVEGDTFDHNTASDAGAAIYNTGQLNVVNSTFDENTANTDNNQFGGGADLFNVHGMLTANSDTFSESHGGSVANLTSTGALLAVNNSLFAIDTGGGFDCFDFGAGSGLSGVDNVVTNGDTSCPGLIAAPDHSPSVGLLQVVKAGTPPVLPLSPSFSGNANAAVGAAGNDGILCPGADERGMVRPTSACDAGAYQYNPATNISVSSAENPSVFGDPVVLTALVTLVNDVGTPGGTVQFSIDGSPVGTLSTVDSNGNATFVTSTLAAGPHDVTAAFTTELDASYSDSTTTAPFVQTVDVSGSSVQLTSSQNPSPAGASITLTVKVSGAIVVPTGTVSLSDTSTTPATVIASGLALDPTGVATFDTSALPLGIQLLVAKYSGDANNAPGTSPALSQDVQTPSSVSITPSLTTTNYGVPDVLTISVPTTAPGIAPTGSVEVDYPSSSGPVFTNVPLDGSGNATLIVATLPVGSDLVHAQYLGDAVYAPSVVSSTSVTINAAATSTTETVVPTGPVSYGTPVVVTAVVTDTSFDSVANPDGSVTFSTPAGTLGTGTLVAGANDTSSASYTTTSVQLALGSNDVTATYVPSTNFVASSSAATTVTVTQASTSVALTSNAIPSVFGQMVGLKATVSATGGSTAVPQGVVTFTEGPTVLGMITLTSGSATLGDASLLVGTHSIVASYGATASFSGSASSALSQVVALSPTSTALTVTPLGANTFGTTLRLVVVVAASGDGSGTPGGQVVITDNGSPLTSMTLSGGQGEFDTAVAGVASHVYLASYQGSFNFDTSSNSQTFVVAPASTSSSLSAAPTSSVFGNTVTLTDTVITTSVGSGAAPTGTVTFSTGSITLGTASLVPTGPVTSTATLTTNALPESAFNPRGEETVTATLDGGSNFVSSTGTAIVKVAQGTTAVNLQASSTAVGTPTTLTATVTVSSGAGTPTGSVGFSDSLGRNLGTAPLVGGQAVKTGILFPVGDDTVTATYTSGDINFVAGAPATLLLHVGPGTLELGVTATVVGPVYGQNDDLTATLAGGSGPTPTGTVTFTASGPGGTVTLGTTSLSGSGPAVAELHLSAVPIPAGALTITASYTGDGNYNAETATTPAPTVTAAPTVTTVTSSQNPSSVQQLVTFTAAVTDPTTGAVPVGSVTFSRGGNELSTVALDGSGHAVVTLTPTTSGSFALSAVYAPGSNFSGSTGSVTQTVNLLSSDVSITSVASQLQLGQGTTFSATVQATNLVSQFATSAPTGTVTISDGQGNGCIITLGPQFQSNLSFGSCQASWNTAGQFTVTGTYSGDTQFASGTSRGIGLFVGQLTPGVSLSSNPSSFVTGEPVTFNWSVVGPTVADANITLSIDGTTLCTSTALIGSCTYTWASNARSGGSVRLFYPGDAAWLSGVATLQQAVISCVPFNAPSVSPAGTGTVTVITQPNCDGGTGYKEGTPIAMVETPAPNYSFQEWLDTGSSASIETITATYPGPNSDEAIFNPVCVSLSLSTTDPNAAPGTIVSSVTPNCGPVPREWHNTPTAIVGSFASGTTLTLTATPPAAAASGVTQSFYQWFGDVSAAQTYTPSISITITRDLAINAKFAVTCFHNITFPTPSGGTAVLSGPNCTDPTGPGYVQLSKATVSTHATGTQYFSHWSNNVAATATTSSGSSGTVLISQSNQRVTATYASCVSFNVVASGDGPDGGPLGTVSATPAGDCPTQGAGWYTTGTTIDIHSAVIGNTGGIFNGWSSGEPLTNQLSNPDNYFAISANGTATASFYYGLGCQPLVTQAVPLGSATISTTFPAGNSCPTGLYDNTVTSTGAPITFTATPTSGNPILGWTGDTTVEGAGNSYSPRTFNGVRGATFSSTFLGPSDMYAWSCEAINPTVTLISPNGTPHTGPSPSDADFIDASPAPYCPLGPLEWTVGTILAPAANAPAVGYTFTGWSGAESGSDPRPGGFVLDGAAHSVDLNATYQVICYTLTANVSGVITALPASPAPNCPDTPASANKYIGGTTVTVQETTPGGYDFTGWTGTADGTSGSFAYTTMSSDITITANFKGKSNSEKIADAIDSAGNAIAITAKKVTGVVAAVASGLLIGLNPVTGVAGVLDLLGMGVSYVLAKLGVSGSGLDGLNQGLDYVAETLSMLTAAISCGTVWSANANTTNNTLQESTGQIGNVASAALQAKKATDDANAEVAAEQAAENAAAEQQYGLTGVPGELAGEGTGGAAVSTGITGGIKNGASKAATALESGASSLADSAGALATKAGKALTFVSKYGSRLGVVGAVAGGIYSEVTSGPNVGWDSSADAAWTGGADVYNSCVAASEPSYMGGPSPSSSSPSGA